jgi:hypothetical protein
MLRQVTVPVIGRVLVLRDVVLGIAPHPILADLFVRVVLQVEVQVFRAAALHHIDMLGEVRIVRQDHRRLGQDLLPQLGVQLTIAEMIGAVKEHPEPGEENLLVVPLALSQPVEIAHHDAVAGPGHEHEDAFRRAAVMPGVAP